VVEVGDVVGVGERSIEWPAFVFVTTPDGGGWVPERLLTADRPDAVVLERYDTTELPAEPGDQLTIVERDDESGWWWCRNDAGAEGWVPVTVLEIGHS
jgi:hypothetical protein